MQLSNFCELERDLSIAPTDSGQQGLDPAYEDEESFVRVRRPAQSHSRQLPDQVLAHRRASATDDDDVADVALHFGNR